MKHQKKGTRDGGRPLNINDLRKYCKVAGLRYNYSELVKDCVTRKDCIDKLLALLKEAGLEGEPNMGKCKEIYAKRNCEEVDEDENEDEVEVEDEDEDEDEDKDEDKEEEEVEKDEQPRQEKKRHRLNGEQQKQREKDNGKENEQNREESDESEQEGDLIGRPLTIDELKKYCKVAGLQYNYRELVKDCVTRKDCTDKLLALLKEAGLEGKPDMEKCKAINAKRNHEETDQEEDEEEKDGQRRQMKKRTPPKRDKRDQERSNQRKKDSGKENEQSGEESDESEQEEDSFGKRLKTFADWPEDHPVAAEFLADAGFTRYGKTLVVRCDKCDLEVFKWKAGEDPWVKHALKYPPCNFVREKKGDNFIKKHQIQATKKHPGPKSRDCGVQNNDSNLVRDVAICAREFISNETVHRSFLNILNNLRHGLDNLQKRRADQVIAVPAKKAKMCCKECGKSYISHNALQKHVISQHELNCEICGEIFDTPRSYSAHSKICKKSGFNCEICDKRFSSEDFLRKHLARQHGIEGSDQNRYLNVP